MYFAHVIFISHTLAKYMASNIHIFCCIDIVCVIKTFLHLRSKSSSFLEGWCILQVWTANLIGSWNTASLSCRIWSETELFQSWWWMCVWKVIINT